MEEKKCSKCNAIKPFSEFYFRNGKPISECKECRKKKVSQYYHENKEEIKSRYNKSYATEYRQINKRTVEGWYTKTYGRMKRDNKTKFNLELPFTKEEFIQWIQTKYKDKFKKLFQQYIDSDCDKYLNPSIDRIDDYKSYTFDNMQLITWRENDNKGSHGIKNKVSCAEVGKQYCSKVVLQYSLDNELLMTFSSTHEVERILNIDSSLIAHACRNYKKGNQGYAKGYL